MSQIISDTLCTWEQKFVFVVFNIMKPDFSSVQRGELSVHWVQSSLPPSGEPGGESEP